LIIIFFLVLDQLNGDQLLVLVIEALNDLAKGPLTDNFDELEAVGDVVSFLNAVVPFFVVKPVVDESFQLGGLDLGFVRTQEIDLVVLIHLGLLEVSQILLGDLWFLGLRRSHWEIDGLVHRFVRSQLVSLRSFRNYRIDSLHIGSMAVRLRCFGH